MSKTIIAEDLVITGNLSGSAEIEVAGTIEGDVTGTTLDILSDGNITGAVKTQTAHIRGTLKGSLTATMVEVHSGANCVADISAKDMEMHKGASIKGALVISGAVS
ncbi:polymer-forming cytoskeletal protein [Falsihalocynthiibacter sp. SS001]|uniref:bactofilin family protein n=1 Tax=Falsihalocynthiibacter sp. SS001 TaxID=3349698 RepID=UPI0036D3EA25